MEQTKEFTVVKKHKQRKQKLKKTLSQRIEKLNSLMLIEVKKENYEQACIYRDLIVKLKN